MTDDDMRGVSVAPGARLGHSGVALENAAWKEVRKERPDDLSTHVPGRGLGKSGAHRVLPCRVGGAPGRAAPRGRNAKPADSPPQPCCVKRGKVQVFEQRYAAAASASQREPDRAPLKGSRRDPGITKIAG